MKEYIRIVALSRFLRCSRGRSVTHHRARSFRR